MWEVVGQDIRLHVVPSTEQGRQARWRGIAKARLGSSTTRQCRLRELRTEKPKKPSGCEPPATVGRRYVRPVGRADRGLSVAPVTIVELAGALPDMRQLYDFLADYRIESRETWGPAESETAHAAWADALTHRRQNAAPRRPIADVFIGAFAHRRAGLITRNPDDFRTLFPKLRQRIPESDGGG